MLMSTSAIVLGDSDAACMVGVEVTDAVDVAADGNVCADENGGDSDGFDDLKKSFTLFCDMLMTQQTTL